MAQNFKELWAKRGENKGFLVNGRFKSSVREVIQFQLKFKEYETFETLKLSISLKASHEA